MGRQRTALSREKYSQPDTTDPQVFGTGRKKGTLNLKTLLEREALNKTAIKMKHNPYEVNILMTEYLMEDYLAARKEKDHKIAAIYAEILSKYIDRTVNKLLPNRFIENEKDNVDYISLLPKIVPADLGNEEVIEINPKEGEVIDPTESN